MGDEGVVGYDIHLRNQNEKSICRQNRLGLLFEEERRLRKFLEWVWLVRG